MIPHPGHATRFQSGCLSFTEGSRPTKHRTGVRHAIKTITLPPKFADGSWICIIFAMPLFRSRSIQPVAVDVLCRFPFPEDPQCSCEHLVSLDSDRFRLLHCRDHTNGSWIFAAFAMPLIGGRGV